MLSGYIQLVLAIIVGAIFLFGIPAAVFLPPYLRYRNEMRLLATGAAAWARILSVRETGRIHNNRSEAQIELEVTHPDRGTWRASFRRIMGIEDIQYFVPGRTIGVRFDPAEPGNVAPAP